MPDLPGMLDHFRARVVQDALTEATAHYWRRRADTLEAARPRPGDFTGKATSDEIAAVDRRLTAAARACRERAAVSLLGGDSDG